MKPCSATIFSSYCIKEKKNKQAKKNNKTTCRHMKRYYFKRISFGTHPGLQQTLPLLSASMQRKQSFAKINPIESDSFHWPRINTACFMSLPNIHIRNTHTHTPHTLKTFLWEWAHPVRNDLSAYRLTHSPGDTEVHYDRLAGAKGLALVLHCKLQHLHHLIALRAAVRTLQDTHRTGSIMLRHVYFLQQRDC